MKIEEITINDEIKERMMEAAAMMKEACRMKYESGSCKGCPFNKLTSGKGEYDDFEWSDEDDKNCTNTTFCELYLGEYTAPQYWELERLF